MTRDKAPDSTCRAYRAIQGVRPTPPIPSAQKIPGIYQIVNTTTRHVYIGQSENIQRRWDQHRRALTQHQHHAPLLQEHWDTYGGGIFSFEIVEILPPRLLREREAIWLEVALARHVMLYNSVAPQSPRVLASYTPPRLE